MRYKVPQDVQREDTIIGPITLKQMVILGIGGGIAYALFIQLSKNYFIEVWIIPVVLITAITLAFAFIKVHNLTFTAYLLHLTEYLYLPKSRQWSLGGGDVFESQINVIQKSKESTEAEKKQQEDQETSKDLNKLSEILDSHNKN